MFNNKLLSIDNIIKKIGQDIVIFNYICVKLIDVSFNIHKKVYNVYNELLMIFLTRILMLRDYRKPVRKKIINVNLISNLDNKFIDCIVTSNFKIQDSCKYICFFSATELSNGVSMFTSDFLSQLINKNIFHDIFSVFVPIEILYFENLEKLNKDYYERIADLLTKVSNDTELLKTKLINALDYVANDLPLEARVYLAQIFALDYRDIIFQACNKLILKQYKIICIKNVDIYYH